VKVLSILLLIIIVGCSAQSPTYSNLSDSQSITTSVVYIYPAIDIRQKQSKNVNLQNISKQLADGLSDKGLNTKLSTDFGNVKQSEISSLSRDELYKIGPPDSNLILLVFLNDMMTDYKVVSYSINVEISGILLDKSKKSVLWRDRATGFAQSSGVTGILDSSKLRSDALYQAVTNLLSKFTLR